MTEFNYGNQESALFCISENIEKNENELDKKFDQFEDEMKSRIKRKKTSLPAKNLNLSIPIKEKSNDKVVKNKNSIIKTKTLIKTSKTIHRKEYESKSNKKQVVENKPSIFTLNFENKEQKYKILNLIRNDIFNKNSKEKFSKIKQLFKFLYSKEGKLEITRKFLFNYKLIYLNDFEIFLNFFMKSLVYISFIVISNYQSIEYEYSWIKIQTIVISSILSLLYILEIYLKVSLYNEFSSIKKTYFKICFKIF